jgi:hypothetical protein
MLYISIYYYGGVRDRKFIALRFSKLCPLILLKKVDKMQGKWLGSEEDRNWHVLNMQRCKY